MGRKSAGKRRISEKDQDFTWDVEETLKEKQVEFGYDPRFEHNLVTILNELGTIGIPISEDIYAKASILSNYYMAARYPGYRDLEFGEETAEEAYLFAMDVVEYISRYYADNGKLCVREPVDPRKAKLRT